MFKRKGGGVKGFLNNVKKLHFSCMKASLIFKYLTLSISTNPSRASLLVSHFHQKTLIGRTTWRIRQHIPQPGWTTKRDDDHRWQSTMTKEEQKMTPGQRREIEQVVVGQVSPALSGLCSHQNMDAVWSSQWGMQNRLSLGLCASCVFAIIFYFLGIDGGTVL